MTLVVEDGTVIDGADSYVTVDEANAYWFTRALANDQSWVDAESADKEAALRQATAFLDDAYVWNGTVVDGGQDLQWPRAGIYDRNGYPLPTNEIPSRLKRAVFVLAKEALSGALIEVENRDATLKSKTVEVAGAIKESLSYADHTSTRKHYPEVDRLLAGFYASKSDAKTRVAVRA